MTARASDLIPIECVPGVEPYTDKTAFSTQHFTWSEKIRFINDFPQKIGGWLQFDFDNGATVDGTARTLYSASLSGLIYTIIGTNTKLYSLIGSELENITPLQTSTVAIANSLATHFATLGNNPIGTVSGSNIVTVTDSEASKFQVNDSVTLSGATTNNGITNVMLNTSHIIRSVSASSYTFRVSGNASGTGSGGGASVVRSSGLLTVTAASHGQANGDRVKINAAANTGGILATAINLEFIIRNVVAGAFDITTAGTATSRVSAAGGASTTYQKEIADGALNQSFGQGYGVGFYGTGLYGVSRISNTPGVYPRIWFTDRFGDEIVTTPGNQTGLYSWDGSSDAAPMLVSGAPTAINYSFISDNIAVTFGAGGVQNKIFASDQGNITQWVASSTNQVFEDNIEGAGRLLSHVSVNGVNLLFTDNQTYSFTYIGLPLVWNITLQEPNIGIIAPMARVSVGGTGYWMDDNNFYQWNGGNIDVIPSNTSNQSTVHNWMYGDLNFAQKSKTFAWYNPEFNEVWFHSLSSDSNEPDKVARLNVIDKTWVLDFFDRTAAEWPNISLSNPRLINVGTLYKHEIGYNDNDSPMPWTLVTNLRSMGRYTTNIDGVVPDSEQTGDITVNIKTKRFPQSAVYNQDNDYTVTPTTERIPYTTNGGYWQYTVSGEELDQFWRAGKWQEYVLKGAAN